MPEVIGADDLERLLAQGGQLVEVLPRDEYAWAHLPGARNIPLKELEAHVDELDRAAPVIVYCHDYLCDLSPRAAWRLEHLGFTDAYDYAVSKMDWLARGRDYEGDADLVSRHLRPDVARCSPATPVGDMRARVDREGICVVVNDAGVVFGAVDAKTLETRQGATAEDVMRPGVSTVRPSEERGKLDERLASRNIQRIVVTDLEGRLLGLYSPR
jgi:rhodanese-related sulfurtransferase